MEGEQTGAPKGDFVDLGIKLLPTASDVPPLRGRQPALVIIFELELELKLLDRPTHPSSPASYQLLLTSAYPTYYVQKGVTSPLFCPSQPWRVLIDY